jgi:N-acyl-D-aspartate/D-glutamate deacylase
MLLSDDNGTRRIDTIAELLQHPRVLPGTSDGGAHSKHGNGGFWSTDMIIWLTRETDGFSIEQVHEMIGRNARAFGFAGRGQISVGAPADLMIYDHAALDIAPKREYEVAHDLPGGDWRKIKRAVGVRYIVVNGVITFIDGIETGATPGQIIANGEDVSAARATIAAE